MKHRATRHTTWRAKGSTTFALLLIGLLTSAPGGAAGTVYCPRSAPVCGRLQSALDDLSRYGVLGAVLAIETPGRTAISIVSGHADVTRTIPMDASRAFQVGSQSKMFTAAAILLLAKDGRLTLDDPVARFIPEAGSIDGVTIRHLLTHTSGVGDGIDLFDAAPEPPSSHFRFDDLLLLSRIYGPQFVPGTQWKYNNTAYDMLGRIIEVASGESRSSFLRRRVLAPLGMHHTFIGTEEDWSGAKAASGYVWSEKSGRLIDMTRPTDLTWAAAAGDMISDADDLLRWTSSLVHSRSPAHLSLDDFTVSAATTGLQDSLVEYGNGMGGFSIAGRRAWGHGGFIHGYISFSAIDPATRKTIVLLTSLAGRKGTEYAALKSAMITLVAVAFEANPP